MSSFSKEKEITESWRKSQKLYDETDEEQKRNDAKEQIDKIMKRNNYLVIMCSLGEKGSDDEAEIWSTIKDIPSDKIESLLYSISQSFKITDKA